MGIHVQIPGKKASRGPCFTCIRCSHLVSDLGICAWLELQFLVRVGS